MLPAGGTGGGALAILPYSLGSTFWNSSFTANKMATFIGNAATDGAKWIETNGELVQRQLAMLRKIICMRQQLL
jgi:hypothetical protein